MKLLVILPRFPYPLEKGDKLRAYNHIRFLSKKHDIILCALNDTEVRDEYLQKLEPYCDTIHVFKISKLSILTNLTRALFTGIPFQAGYFYNKKIQQQIDQIIQKEKPDHIFCQLLRVAEYAINSTIPKTIDYQDVFSMGIQRRISKVPFYLKPVFKSEYKRLAKYENKLFDIFDNKTIISLPDRDLIPHKDKAKIHIIPNGVDHDFFKPLVREKKYEIVFIGNMSYAPNVDAAEYLAQKVLPLVHQQKPEVKLLLAGASPAKRVQDLQNEFVHITGWVDDIRDCYAEARIFIAPMQIGTGLQNKLLEAMAMKIPSITSKLANSALYAKDGEEILIGETPEDYAKHIIKLLNDDEFATRIADAGYRFVNHKYNWEIATNKLSDIMTNTNEVNPD
jgi:sugar transferase (PEP-CTERM/EpsH1 system associated)